jgi:hypothetical protein
MQMAPMRIIHKALGARRSPVTDVNLAYELSNSKEVPLTYILWAL